MIFKNQFGIDNLIHLGKQVKIHKQIKLMIFFFPLVIFGKEFWSEVLPAISTMKPSSTYCMILGGKMGNAK